ncbi:MAG: hypothetical protein SNH27_17935 [Rikenellaceae bacterium]
MNIWFAILLVVEVLLFLFFVRYHKRFPILNMPFDYRYRVFKRAYRAYKPVREGRKLFHIYSSEFVIPYKNILEYSDDYSHDEARAATTIVDIITTKQELLEGYFQGQFGYAEYLDMMAKYDMIELENRSTQTKQYSIPLLRKIMIFEALFRTAKVDVDGSKRSRFMRNLLEVEMETEKISNTNIYKQLKKSKNSPETDKEIKARIDDLAYVINELKMIGLEKESQALQNELDEFSEQVIL